jgi:hypothetical protein
MFHIQGFNNYSSNEKICVLSFLCPSSVHTILLPGVYYLTSYSPPA